MRWRRSRTTAIEEIYKGKGRRQWKVVLMCKREKKERERRREEREGEEKEEK